MNVATIAREEAPGGLPILSLRTIDGYDFRSQLSPSDRTALERSGAVTIGNTQMRIDLEAAAGDWRDLLVRALEAAAPVPDAVAVTA